MYSSCSKENFHLYRAAGSRDTAGRMARDKEKRGEEGDENSPKGLENAKLADIVYAPNNARQQVLIDRRNEDTIMARQIPPQRAALNAIQSI